MAIVTTTFSSAAGDAWASSTWASGDPSYKVDAQLQAWVSAINDASKISIIHTPGNATARGSSDEVYWLLRCRESDTSTDYGIKFAALTASGGSATSGAYYSRSSGSANNGGGTFSQVTITGNGSPTLNMASYASTYRTAYDAEGATPWFALMATASTSPVPVGYISGLIRLSTGNMAAGSYYPSTGLGKWAYFYVGGGYGYQSPDIYFVTPQRGISAPYIGVNSSKVLRHPRPDISKGDGYFFKLGAQYGDTHFLGEPTYDILVSNGNTGDFGDTVVLEGKTFIRAIGALWIRIA